MFRFWIAAVLVLTLVQVESVAATDEMGARVTALGLKSTFRDLEYLDQFGCSAVPPLVSELRVVPDKELTADEQVARPSAAHVAWVVAALRHITGVDYYGRVERSKLKHFSERAKFFLTEYAPSGEVKFFANWMSRGTLYFAPADAQRQIIRKWKDYVASGACTTATNPERKKVEFWMYGNRQPPP